MSPENFLYELLCCLLTALAFVLAVAIVERAHGATWLLIGLVLGGSLLLHREARRRRAEAA